VDNELAVLGAALLLAGLFARFGRRIGLPTIPFFIVAGIIFGPETPGIVILEDPHELETLATVGLVLLLFHLGVGPRDFVGQMLGSIPEAAFADVAQGTVGQRAVTRYGLTVGQGTRHPSSVHGHR